MKKIKDLRHGMEYDFDEQTQTVSKMLRCYHSDGSVTEERYEYEYVPEHFSEPYESELESLVNSL